MAKQQTKPVTRKDKIIKYLMSKRLFIRLYWWWGIRQAGKARREYEQRLANSPHITHDEYWDAVHAKNNNIPGNTN